LTDINVKSEIHTEIFWSQSRHKNKINNHLDSCRQHWYSQQSRCEYEIGQSGKIDLQKWQERSRTLMTFRNNRSWDSNQKRNVLIKPTKTKSSSASCLWEFAFCYIKITY